MQKFIFEIQFKLFALTFNFVCQKKRNAFKTLVVEAVGEDCVQWSLASFVRKVWIGAMLEEQFDVS